MAELLIYDKEHWVDELSEAEFEAYVEREPKFTERVSARLQRGDVVAVREDGHYIINGFDDTAFAVVSLPGIDISEVEYLIEPDVDIFDKVLHKRKHKVELVLDGKITIKAKKSDLKIKDKTQ